MLWLTDANCTVLVFCLVGFRLSDATVVQSEAVKMIRRTFVMETVDAVGTVLVNVRTLILRLQERVLDQRQGCSHLWLQEM
jgi:hypothetical protein